jgi:hypothetical protein
MNQRIKELAQEANAYAISINAKDGNEFETAFNEKFADLIRADEREACVSIFEKHWKEEWFVGQIRNAIRARGNT